MGVCVFLVYVPASVFRFRSVSLSLNGISCDEMVSPNSTVAYCGLKFSQSQPLIQTDIVCWMGARARAHALASVSQLLSHSLILSISALKLLNNLLSMHLLLNQSRYDVHAGSRTINNRRIYFFSITKYSLLCISSSTHRYIGFVPLVVCTVYTQNL